MKQNTLEATVTFIWWKCNIIMRMVLCVFDITEVLGVLGA